MPACFMGKASEQYPRWDFMSQTIRERRVDVSHRTGYGLESF